MQIFCFVRCLLRVEEKGVQACNGHKTFGWGNLCVCTDSPVQLQLCEETMTSGSVTPCSRSWRRSAL